MSSDSSTADVFNALARVPCPQVEVGEAERLKVLTCNYLALGQFELARCCMASLYKRDPLAALRVLDDVILVGPPRDWVCSHSVPSSSHLAWMCSIVRHELHGVQRPMQFGRDYVEWRFASLEFDVILLNHVKRSALRKQEDTRKGTKSISFTQAVHLRTAYFQLLFHAFPNLNMQFSANMTMSTRERFSMSKQKDHVTIPHMSSFMPHLAFDHIPGFAEGAAAYMHGQEVQDAACSVAEVVNVLEFCMRKEPTTGRELWRLFMRQSDCRSRAE